VTPARHETVVTVIPLNIRNASAIDRQTNRKFSSNVRGSLHDQVSAFVVDARLGLTAAGEEYASESENHQDSAGGTMSFHN
jgi:hypothetical protein